MSQELERFESEWRGKGIPGCRRYSRDNQVQWILLGGLISVGRIFDYEHSFVESCGKIFGITFYGGGEMSRKRKSKSPTNSNM